jgi:hypothetical protein
MIETLLSLIIIIILLIILKKNQDNFAPSINCLDDTEECFNQGVKKTINIDGNKCDICECIDTSKYAQCFYGRQCESKWGCQNTSPKSCNTIVPRGGARMSYKGKWDLLDKKICNPTEKKIYWYNKKKYDCSNPNNECTSVTTPTTATPTTATPTTAAPTTATPTTATPTTAAPTTAAPTIEQICNNIKARKDCNNSDLNCIWYRGNKQKPAICSNDFFKKKADFYINGPNNNSIIYERWIKKGKCGRGCSSDNPKLKKIRDYAITNTKSKDKCELGLCCGCDDCGNC